MCKFLRLAAMVCLACWLAAGTPAFAQKAEPAPAKAAKVYELRMIRVGDMYEAIRFKVATGESWLAEGGKWEKIPETGDVAAGDFEVTMVATEKDFVAMR